MSHAPEPSLYAFDVLNLDGRLDRTGQGDQSRSYRMAYQGAGLGYSAGVQAGPKSNNIDEFPTFADQRTCRKRPKVGNGRQVFDLRNWCHHLLALRAARPEAAQTAPDAPS
jgi:hypothetical protein